MPPEIEKGDEVADFYENTLGKSERFLAYKESLMYSFDFVSLVEVDAEYFLSLHHPALDTPLSKKLLPEIGESLFEKAEASDFNSKNWGAGFHPACVIIGYKDSNGIKTASTLGDNSYFLGDAPYLTINKIPDDLYFSLKKTAKNAFRVEFEKINSNNEKEPRLVEEAEVSGFFESWSYYAKIWRNPFYQIK